jgi:hypothetical protein
MVRSAAAILAVLILPSFAQAQEPQGTHTVVRGNTLWDLAQSYYQNPFEWRVIWEANRGVVEDPNWIYPDEVLVIPGLPARTPTAAQPAVEVPPPVTTETPRAAEAVPQDLVPFGFRQARPTDEVRSIFYRDTAAARAIASQSLERDYVAVSSDAAYSAPWLVGLEDEVVGTGVIEGFADEGDTRASTIRSFQRVLVEMPSPARVGANLQVFRVGRTIETVGKVVAPTGVLTVTTIGDGYVVGTILKEYDRIQPGDMVRPLPTYTQEVGVYAEEISGGSEAMIMGFAGRQILSDIGHIAFLDLGSDDGVAVGDEFILYGSAVPTAREGSLQVVGVSEGTSAARILSMSDDVFRQGVVVRLAKKMR